MNKIGVDIRQDHRIEGSGMDQAVRPVGDARREVAVHSSPAAVRDAAPDSSTEWRDGWRVLVAAAFGSGFGYSLFQTSAGIFIRPMQEEFGWSTSMLAIAPVVLLVGSLLLPLGGMIVDRWGPRPVAILGLCLFVLIYVMFALMPGNKLAFYMIAGFVALVSPLAYYGAFLKAVGGWFRQNTGTAVGINMNGITVSTVIALPVVGYAIDRWGWRAGYLSLAGLVLIFGLPVVLAFFRERPATEGGPTIEATPTPGVPAGAADRTLRDAVRDPRFWLLLLSFVSATLALGGYLAHLQPLLRRVDLSAQAAASVGVLMAVSIGIGRLAGGFLLDRIWPYGIAAMCLLPPIAGTLYLAQITPGSPIPLISIAVVLIGLAHGAEADFLAFFALKLFGRQYFSTIFGVLAMASLFGSASGGVAFSLIVDRFGGYAPGCYAAGYLFFQSALLLIAAGLIDRRIRGRDERLAR